MQGSNSISMFANYLADVGKLVYIVGQPDATTTIKKFLDTNDNKYKIVYKCLSEVPPNTYKSGQVESFRRGILRVDWITKIIDKSPEMIMAVFNCSAQLAQNEKWQDRLGIIIRKINKIYQILKMSKKQDNVLKVIIIISKNIINGVNVVEKIKQFLKFYEKDLHIVLNDNMAKDIPKLKVSWLSQLDKNYDKRFKEVLKRIQETYNLQRLGNYVKLAILSQLLSRKDQFQRYSQAYEALKTKFSERIKSGNVNMYTYDEIRQLRVISDIVILRWIKLKLSYEKKLGDVKDMIIGHLQFYKMKNMNQKDTHQYYYYQQLIWRCGYIQNMLQVIHNFQELEVISSNVLAQLVNAIITYLYSICSIKESILKKSPNGKQIEIGDMHYCGSVNYTHKGQFTELDIVYTKMKELLSQRKDYVAKASQLITRYKGMQVFSVNELAFLNIYLLRFYIVDGKFEAMVPIFNKIMQKQVKKHNYYLLNRIFKLISVLLKDIKNYANEIQDSNKFTFYAISVIICDYFRNQQELSRYGNKFAELIFKADSNIFEEGQQPLLLTVKKNSYIFSAEIQIQDRFKPIQESINIKIRPKIAQMFTFPGSKLEITFTDQNVKYENITIQDEINLCINPLDYLKQEETLQIKDIKLIFPKQSIIWVLNSQQIIFPKNDKIFIYTQVRIPQVNILNPFKVCYINQIVPVKITIEDIPNCQVEAKISIKEPNQKGRTQFFVNLQDKMNITNTKGFLSLKVKENNVLYMKLNGIGQKSIKYCFAVTVKKMFDHDSNKCIKNYFSFTKDDIFYVENLFEIQKAFRQTPSGVDLRAFQVPIYKIVSLHFKIWTHQTIQIVQLGHHKNPKLFQFLKEIKVQNTMLTNDEKFRALMIFKLIESTTQPQFLAKFYIKWKRIGLDEDIQNLYADDQIIVKPIVSKVQISLTVQNNIVKKKKSALIVHIKNLTQNIVNTQVIVNSTQQMLRIGQKTKISSIKGKQEITLFFEILPTKSGYFPYPRVIAFVDGTQMRVQNYGNLIYVE